MNLEGPAPRPLDRAKDALTPEGLLVVDKGQQFTVAPDIAPDQQYSEESRLCSSVCICGCMLKGVCDDLG